MYALGQIAFLELFPQVHTSWYRVPGFHNAFTKDTVCLQ